MRNFVNIKTNKTNVTFIIVKSTFFYVWHILYVLISMLLTISEFLYAIFVDCYQRIYCCFFLCVSVCNLIDIWYLNTHFYFGLLLIVTFLLVFFFNSCSNIAKILYVPIYINVVHITLILKMNKLFAFLVCLTIIQKSIKQNDFCFNHYNNKLAYWHY